MGRPSCVLQPREEEPGGQGGQVLEPTAPFKQNCSWAWALAVTPVLFLPLRQDLTMQPKLASNSR